ncbi:hypothetical protein WJT86_03085 [Microvirga sp. W0021]|uniref:PIR Superfamily Protein n=1 Tax=Hohaiivirga grylli TaxID=3133970 RepID=A0ABV0BGK8_9HYPH
MEESFRSFRLAALKIWLENTKRIREESHDDDYSNSYECSWQNRCEDFHVGLFCGIANWMTHITDILLDESIDDCNFENHSNRIARYYNLILFILSELINDMKDSSKSFKVNMEDYASFVNNVVKHKFNFLHKNNNHLCIFFEEEGDFSDFNVISLRPNYKCEEYDLILYPSLNKIINSILDLYERYDNFLKDENQFRNICESSKQICSDE